jgi:hypothetical protein
MDGRMIKILKLKIQLNFFLQIKLKLGAPPLISLPGNPTLGRALRALILRLAFNIFQKKNT